MIDNINITKCKKENRQEIENFFALMVDYTYKINDIDSDEDLKNEIADKIALFNTAVKNDNKSPCLYVAKKDEKIIGTLAYFPVSKLISDLSEGKAKGLFEIGCALVDVNCQRQGVIDALMKEVLEELILKGEKEVTFDCGYNIAQKIWTKKFGTATLIKENYWSSGSSHMIWILNPKDMLKNIN